MVAICEPFPSVASPAAQESLERFVAHGILKAQSSPSGYITTPSGYITTPRGAAYVAMICATHMPVSALVDPRTGEVVEAH